MYSCWCWRHYNNRRINSISVYASICSTCAVGISECPGLVTCTNWVSTCHSSTDCKCSAAVVCYNRRSRLDSVNSTSYMYSCWCWRHYNNRRINSISVYASICSTCAVGISECPGLVTCTNWVSTCHSSTDCKCSAAVVCHNRRSRLDSVNSTSYMYSYWCWRHYNNRRINSISVYASICSSGAVGISEYPGLVTCTNWVSTCHSSTDCKCSAAVVCHNRRSRLDSVNSTSYMYSCWCWRHYNNRRINSISVYASICSTCAVGISECPGLVTCTNWISTCHSRTDCKCSDAVVWHNRRSRLDSVNSTSYMYSCWCWRHYNNRRINSISVYASICSTCAVGISECPGLVTCTNWVSTCHSSTDCKCSAAVVCHNRRSRLDSVNSTSYMYSCWCWRHYNNRRINSISVYASICSTCAVGISECP